MTPPLLMPEPEEQDALGLSHSEMRRWWNAHVLKLKTKRARKDEPGVIDLLDETEG